MKQPTIIMAELTTQQRILSSTKDFAVTVKDARLSLRISQQELSARTGIPRPWISQLEQGRIENPGLAKCLTICSALGISLHAEYSAATSDNASLQQYMALLRQLGYVVQTDAVPTDTGNHTSTPQSNSPFEETLLALKQRQQAVQRNAKQLDYGTTHTDESDATS